MSDSAALTPYEIERLEGMVLKLQTAGHWAEAFWLLVRTQDWRYRLGMDPAPAFLYDATPDNVIPLPVSA